MNQNLILIFARNPEIGKVKTRLAATVGDENALEIYKILLNHTKNIVAKIAATRRVLYSDQILENDLWENHLFQKKVQSGFELGERMKNAFVDGFSDQFKKIIIIGTDLLDLETNDIEVAFKKLDYHDVVIGPAEDGGYYLLGLKNNIKGIFENKNWGTSSVLSATMDDLKYQNVYLLQIKNDIDTADDLKNEPLFQKYIL